MLQSLIHSCTHCLSWLLPHRAAPTEAKSTQLKLFQLALWPLGSWCREINALRMGCTVQDLYSTFHNLWTANTLTILNRMIHDSIPVHVLFALIHINFLPLQHKFCRGRDHMKNSRRVCIGGYKRTDDIFNQECSIKMEGYLLRLRHNKLPCETCENHCRCDRILSMWPVARIQTGLNSCGISQRQNKPKQPCCNMCTHLWQVAATKFKSTDEGASVSRHVKFELVYISPHSKSIACTKQVSYRNDLSQQ